MGRNSLVRVLSLAFLLLLSACSSSQKNTEVLLSGRTLPLEEPAAATGNPYLPALSSLPSGRGTGLRSTSGVLHELLLHPPVKTSPAGADYGNELLSLDPLAAGGVAFAVFELYDFPTDGSISADKVLSSADGSYFLAFSDFSGGRWTLTPVEGTNSVTLGEGLEYYNNTGSMYVAIIAAGGAVELSSLRVETSVDLPNSGYDEREDNDNSAAAQPLPERPFLGFKGSLGAPGYDGDLVDYFSFDASEGEQINIDLSYPAEANFTLTLSKPDSSATLVSDVNGNPGARNINVGLKAGHYTLKVTRELGAGDYLLDVSSTFPGYTESEPNDKNLEANGLGPQLERSGSVGPGSYDNDTVDYFSIDAAEGDVASFSLAYASGSGNLSLSLVTPTGSQLYIDDFANPGLRAFSWGLHEGTNLLIVKAEVGHATYTLSASKSNPGYSELEDNDKFSAAQPMPLLPVADFPGSAGEFGYDGDDKDYFSFSCQDGDIISATLDYDNSVSTLGLRLYDEDESQAALSIDANPGSRTIVQGLRGGDCYVLVEALSGGGDYSLSLTRSHPGYSETEENDTRPTADLLPALPFSAYLASVGATGYDGDITDYFTFDALDQEKFSFSMDYDENVSTVSLTLLNAGGQTIYADNSGNPGLRQFDWALKAGSYFIKLNAEDGVSDCSLAMSKTQLGLSEIEDNDVRAAAMQLDALPIADFTGNCGAFGYDGDADDYFFVNIAAPQSLGASLTYSAADGTLKFYLLDGNGIALDSDTSGNSGVRGVSAAVTPGTYYLRVQCTAGGSDYNMDVS